MAVSERATSPVIFGGSLSQLGMCNAEAVGMCCEFNHNGSLLTAGLSNGNIKVLKCIPSCPEVYRLVSKKSGVLPVTFMRFLSHHTSSHSRDNVMLATYASGYSMFWHVTTTAVLSSRKEERQVLGGAVGPACETFCTVGSDGCVVVQDISTHKIIRVLEPSQTTTLMDGHVNRVFTAKYHPANPNQIISAGWDDTIQFWDIRQTQAVRRISGPHVCGDALHINPVDYRIASGSWRLRDTLQLWDYNTGKLLKTLQPDLNIKAYSLQWMTENHLITGGSQQNRAILLDANRDWVSASVTGLEQGVYDISYSPAGRHLALVSGPSVYLAQWKKRTSSQEILHIP